MTRVIQNTIVVMAITLLTAVGVYGVFSSVEIQPGQAATGLQTETSGVSTATGSLTCPATGCSAVSCHATSGGGHGGFRRGRGARDAGPDTSDTSEWPET